jgi:predicted transcriptional regulator of viral defense system
LSAGQQGLVTAAGANAVGVDGSARRRLVCEGALDAVGPGVYLLDGFPEPSHLEIRVAWLRLDPAMPARERDGLGTNDGVVSHRSACVVHGLGDIPAPTVELIVPRRRRITGPWLRLRVRTELSVCEVTMLDGLPVTTVALTIIDLLRDRADGGHVGGVILDAERRGLIDPDQFAPRVEKFAPSYAMPRASGRDLLSVLVSMAAP